MGSPGGSFRTFLYPTIPDQYFFSVHGQSKGQIRVHLNGVDSLSWHRQRALDHDDPGTELPKEIGIYHFAQNDAPRRCAQFGDFG